MKIDVLPVLFYPADMQRPGGVLLLAALTLALVNSAAAKNKLWYFKLGGRMVLLPAPVAAPVSSIVWKHNDDLVAEWIDGSLELEYYSSFRGRALLDTTSGVLQINNVAAADSGNYSVEINNKVQSERQEALVIREVPKPEVILRPVECSQDSSNCTLICAGHTEDARPVTFFWRHDAGEWRKSERSVVVRNEETQSVRTFACRMKNPVSNEESEPKPNVFFRQPSPAEMAAYAVVPLAAGIVGVALWKTAFGEGGDTGTGTAVDGPEASTPKEVTKKANDAKPNEKKHAGLKENP
ncbi:CD48 antigen-like [Brachyistius frenatus]|uniref:CD48 antigen-like n=1 Tax=Brachyistius frenatus TaxID=100188 RepID=UPI0037E81D28